MDSVHAAGENAVREAHSSDIRLSVHRRYRRPCSTACHKTRSRLRYLKPAITEHHAEGLGPCADLLVA